MRALLAFSFVLWSSCTEHGKGGGVPPDAASPEPPASCAGHCLVEDPDPTASPSELCCDSVTCILDPATHQWEVLFCDPPLDACAACTLEQQCVQVFDGACGATVACIDRVAGCPDSTCTAGCEDAYCGSVAQCQTPIPCGTEIATALHCYGP